MIWTKEWLDSNFEARRKLRFPSLLVQEISCSADVTQFDWAAASFDTQFQNQVLYAGNRYGWNLVLTHTYRFSSCYPWLVLSFPEAFFFFFCVFKRNCDWTIKYWSFRTCSLLIIYSQVSKLHRKQCFMRRSKWCCNIFTPQKVFKSPLTLFFLGINTGCFHCCTAWRASESYAMCRERT